MTVEFRADRERPGIIVVDRDEGRQFPLSTDRPVSFESSGVTAFREPADAATACRIRELALPYVVPVLVRDANGKMIAECNDFAHEVLPAGEYELEIAAPIKLSLRFSGPVTIHSKSDDMRIVFDGPTRVDLAARSYHEGPAATVITTPDPEDMMAAISTFGSALETTSPERSFPSRRGHPPEITLGETHAVPDTLEPPETGLEIEVPPTLPAVYAVATLSYYLGARVIPGSEARLLADGEVIRSLGSREGRAGSDAVKVGLGGTDPSGTSLEEAVTETLQHVFLLDCVVRTEGQYPVDLHERRRLADRVDRTLPELYNAPISERVAKYMDIPFADVQDLVPTWQLSTHLSPEPASVEMLPYAANALSLISVEQQTAVDAVPDPPGYGAFVRSASRTSEPADTPDEPTYIQVSASDTLEQAWFGEGRSANANDLYPDSIRNRFASDPSDGPIEIGVVCNDERMAPEVGDGDLYGDRKDLPFAVSVHRDLTCDELRDLLGADLDFLHYIGHVDQAGFVCRDGALDVSEVDAVGVDTFLLNGCRSYDQGQSLVERESIGGIVTMGAVDNANAIPVGRLVAGLLNAGFSLRSALNIVGQRHPVDGRYTVVGDGGVQVAQSENGTPNVLHIDRAAGSEGYEVRIATYPAIGRGMGSCYTPYAPSINRYFLVGGELPALTLSLPEVVNLLALERVPVIIDGEFRWSNDVEPAELPPATSNHD